MGNWSYNVTQLLINKKDQVRLMIGDVVSTDPQMQDEEIQFFLTLRSSIYGAAAECCYALADKFSRSVDKAAGQSKAAFSQMAKAYAARAASLNTRAAMMGTGMPYFGAISLADMVNQLENPDRSPPQMTVGITDNFLPVPPAGGQTLLLPGLPTVMGTANTGGQTTP